MKFIKLSKKWLQTICEILELAAALFVLAGIIVSIISLTKESLVTLQELINDITVFRHYLEEVFVIVIGIEFLEMLCRPNADNVIQVLVFLVARHMIVGNTSTYENLLSVFSIFLLYILRRYLHTAYKKSRPEVFSSLKKHLNPEINSEKKAD